MITALPLIFEVLINHSLVTFNLVAQIAGLRNFFIVANLTFAVFNRLSGKQWLKSWKRFK
jgi:hypothetical protein